MAAWRLNPALTRFRAEVAAEYPNRDKASDGTIGDAAHASGISDHNPDADGSVDAWDMDVDLHGPGRSASADIERLKTLFQRHPASQYWIHNGRIATRSSGWRRQPYAGDNPHDKHVHWNTRPTFENSTTPWGVHVALTDADARLVVNMLLRANLGTSGPTVGVALQSGYRLTEQIAAKVDIDPAELEAIKAAAREGAVAGADELVAAVVDALPDTALTKADVEEALRTVFTDAATP